MLFQAASKIWSLELLKFMYAPAIEYPNVTSRQQPINNQRYDATEREQTLPIFTKFINIFRVLRAPLPAHNGLVAGSSPAGPTSGINRTAREK
jgi:hypothetical protein